MKALVFILILATALRLYGLNWDQNQHLHPDERFLTMVAQAIKWPGPGQYLDTSTSTLNPHNVGFSFFVYGTFPLFFTKLLAEIFNFSDYNNITLFGRAISAFFDVATVLLIFLIAKKITTKSGSLLAAFLYTISVLPIQLSHFFAVDTFLNFFSAATLYFLIEFLHSPKKQFAATAGFIFGLALASKVTALLLTPAIFLVFTLVLKKQWRQALFSSLIFFIFAVFTFRLAQPYAFASGSFFQINQLFMDNLKELSRISGPDGFFPPSIQWYNTLPLIYPLQNLLFWGLGLPLGAVVLASVIFWSAKIWQSLIKISGNFFKLEEKNKIVLILLLSISTIFIYQGIQFAKSMRYLLPIYPYVVVLTAPALLSFTQKLRENGGRTLTFATFYLLLFTFAYYPLSFMAIYTRPHTRVAASEWIYQNIPPGSSISYEYWDDPLPLNLPTATSSIYHGVQFPLYDPESVDKWQKMNDNLQQVDYIIESSNRLYGGISQKPDKYPTTIDYYQSLFDGSLGFKKVAEFTSRPTFSFPFIRLCLTPPFSNYGQVAKLVQDCSETGLSIVDDYSEESFTVYDHPKVTIFKRI